MNKPRVFREPLMEYLVSISPMAGFFHETEEM
jgi:hypothetical protein